MVRQYAKIEGVTEDLKRSDAMEYARRMNSIRNRVEEFVLHDFVYALHQLNTPPRAEP